MNTLDWRILSVAAGVLMGFGVIISKMVTSVIPSYVFVGILGLVWLLSSLGTFAFATAPVKMGWSIFGLALLAGLLFWAENVLGFHAINKAPTAGHMRIVLEVVGMSLVLGYELARLYKAGKLSSVSYYEIGGFLLAFGAVVLFRLAPNRGS